MENLGILDNKYNILEKRIMGEKEMVIYQGIIKPKPIISLLLKNMIKMVMIIIPPMK